MAFQYLFCLLEHNKETKTMEINVNRNVISWGKYVIIKSFQSSGPLSGLEFLKS